MRKQKSRFWNFWLAFIPGCSEMYMGFMKMGVSLLTAFVGLVAIAAFLDFGQLMLIDCIIWFYSFFHARNMAHMSDQELMQVEDRYLCNLGELEEIWNELMKKHNKIVAILLILFGISLTTKGIFNTMGELIPNIIWRIYNMISRYAIQIIVGVGIIALGIHMVKGKKQELLEEEKKSEL